MLYKLYIKYNKKTSEITLINENNKLDMSGHTLLTSFEAKNFEEAKEKRDAFLNI